MNEPLRASTSTELRGEALALIRGGNCAVVPAGPEHVEAIHALIEAATRSTSVLPRTRESILQHLPGFRVAIAEGSLVGCGALHRMSPSLAEIRSVVVAGSVRGRGVGQAIVGALVEDAHRQGFTRVFTLTDVVDFFARLGFQRTERATLPEKVWNDCRLCPKYLDCNETALDLLLTHPD